MRPHHQRVVDRLVDRFSEDPNFPALLIGGSIARGWEREDSDVDIILIATDAEYARRQKNDDLLYFTTDLCDYPGGYVDGKIVDLAFLREVADHGSEPARSAYVNVQIAYSRLPDLQDLLRRVTTYPEAEREEKLRAFHAQVIAWQWFISEAEKRGDRYLLTQATANLVLYGGRLILAYNHQFYPFHKWFMTVLRETPDKPDGLLELANDLLERPGRETAARFGTAVLDFAQVDFPAEKWGTRFLLDVEWAWRKGQAPLGDR